MNYAELKELFEERKEEGSWEDFTDFLLGDGEVEGFEYVSQDGGGEGGAEDCESVIKVDGDFYKVSYSYYSHHGFEFNYAEARKVVPKEKTITVYE